MRVDLEQYEIFLLTNRYNWLDLSSGGVENTRLAFCGATGQICLKLPFTQFIPQEQLVQFSVKVRCHLVTRDRAENICPDKAIC